MSAEPDAPSTSQRVVQNSLLNIAGRVVHAVVNLGCVFILARRLGPSALGQYYFAFAVMLAVQMILEAGIPTVLTYRLVRCRAEFDRIVGEAGGILAATIVASLAVLTGLGVAAVGLGGDPGTLPLFAAAAVACCAIQVTRFCAGVFRASEQFGRENAAMVGQGLVFVGLLLGAPLSTANPTRVMTALALSHLLAAGYLAVALHARVRMKWARPGARTVRNWLVQAIPLGMGDLLRRLTWQMDTILLAMLQPAAIVGIYSIAYRPLGPLNWLPLAIMTAVFPSVARFADTDRGNLARSFSRSMRLLWIISLPLALTLFVCAEPIIKLLAGGQYGDAVLPMRILAWVTCLSFLSMQFRFLFISLGKGRLYVKLVGLVLGIKVAVELALIPHWGYFGACAGTLAGELVFLVAGVVACQRLRVKTIEWSPLVLTGVCAAAMGMAMWSIRHAALPLLALGMVASIGLYLLLCVRCGSLKSEEARLVVAAALRRTGSRGARR